VEGSRGLDGRDSSGLDEAVTVVGVPLVEDELSVDEVWDDDSTSVNSEELSVEVLAP